MVPATVIRGQEALEHHVLIGHPTQAPLGLELGPVELGRPGPVAQHADHGLSGRGLAGRRALGGGVDRGVDAQDEPGAGDPSGGDVEAGRSHRPAQVTPVGRVGQEAARGGRGADGHHDLAGHDHRSVGVDLDATGRRLECPDGGGRPDLDGRAERLGELGPATVEIADTPGCRRLQLPEGGIGAEPVDVGAVGPEAEEGQGDRLAIGAQAQVVEPRPERRSGQGRRVHAGESGEETGQLQLAAGPEERGAEQ